MIRLAASLLVIGLAACAAAPAKTPQRCDVTIKFGSYGMGIDQPLAATIADMVKTDPDIARAERKPWGREGEFDQCLTVKKGRDAKVTYERYKALIPAKNVKAPTSIEGPGGARFETIGPM